jgi:hypothetical protein
MDGRGRRKNGAVGDDPEIRGDSVPSSSAMFHYSSATSVAICG